jgi:hypothetical protein
MGAGPANHPHLLGEGTEAYRSMARSRGHNPGARRYSDNEEIRTKIRVLISAARSAGPLRINDPPTSGPALQGSCNHRLATVGHVE